MRFPEFSGEWEKCKVSELLDFYSTNSLCWEQLEYDTENISNLHYGLIHVGLPTMVNLVQDRLPNIKDGNKPKNYELCKEGDVAFADASEDTNEVAKAIEFYNLNGRDVICGLHTIHGRDNKDRTVVGFKGYAFSSTAFHNQIRRIAQGTKIYSISTKNFSECYIGIPSKVEQAKIASLLHLIDERIVTQNKIIYKLKSLIRGIAQNMVHRGKPNVRLSDCMICNSSTLQESEVLERLFNAIKGDVVVLEDIGDVVKGKQINGEFLSESGKYYVMNGGIEPSGFYNDYNVEANTISISEGGNSCGYVQFNACPFWSGGHCYTIQNTTDNVKTEYLYQFLKSKESEIMKLRIGSGLPNIQKKDLAKFKITIPNISEQKVISAFLSSFERKADVEMNFVNLLLEEKQYLLRQMFI